MRKPLLILGFAAAVLVLFGAGIGSYPLWDPWEPKYGLAVREMLERGDLLTPYLDGKIRWTKPILIYWAMAASVKLCGDTEFAVRLPSVVSALLGVLMTGWFVSRLRGPRTGLVAAAVLATLPQYFFMARQAMPDMLLTLFLTGAMGFFALARFERGGPLRRWLAACYACLALAFLTKGPVALALFGGTVGLFWLIDFEPRLVRPSAAWAALRSAVATYRPGLGAGIFLALAGPWYGAMLALHGQAFVENFLLDENVQRFREPLFGHQGASNHYVNALLHGLFPWSGLLFASLVFLFAGRRSIDDETRQRWFYLCWFVVVFVLFSLAGTKLDHYLLPITPAAAVLIALVWEARLADAAGTWVRAAFLLAIVATVLPWKDFVVEGNRYIFDAFMPAQDILVHELEITVAVCVVAGTWIAVLAFSALSRHVVAGFALALALAWASGIYFTQRVVPAHSSERTLQAYAEQLADVRGRDPEARVVVYGYIRHSLPYYHGPDFRLFQPEHLDALVAFAREHPHLYIVVEQPHAERMLERLGRQTDVRWTLVSDENPVFWLVANADAARASGI